MYSHCSHNVTNYKYKTSRTVHKHKRSKQLFRRFSTLKNCDFPTSAVRNVSHYWYCLALKFPSIPVHLCLFNQTLSCAMIWRQSWNDMRLQFLPSDIDSKSSTPVTRLQVIEWERVWHPDTFLSGLTAPVQVEHHYMRLSYDGTVWFVRRWDSTHWLLQNLATFKYSMNLIREHHT